MSINYEISIVFSNEIIKIFIKFNFNYFSNQYYIIRGGYEREICIWF
jgi:hypothetical protein